MILKANMSSVKGYGREMGELDLDVVSVRVDCLVLVSARLWEEFWEYWRWPSIKEEQMLFLMKMTCNSEGSMMRFFWYSRIFL